MFETTSQTIPKTKYAKFGPYIVSLDLIHGVMSCKTENKDSPFHVYLTYTDKTSVIIECTNQKENDDVMKRIAFELGAV